MKEKEIALEKPINNAVTNMSKSNFSSSYFSHFFFKFSFQMEILILLRQCHQAHPLWYMVPNTRLLVTRDAVIQTTVNGSLLLNVKLWLWKNQPIYLHSLTLKSLLHRTSAFGQQRYVYVSYFQLSKILYHSIDQCNYF